MINDVLKRGGYYEGAYDLHKGIDPRGKLFVKVWVEMFNKNVGLNTNLGVQQNVISNFSQPQQNIDNQILSNAGYNNNINYNLNSNQNLNYNQGINTQPLNYNQYNQGGLNTTNINQMNTNQNYNSHVNTTSFNQVPTQNLNYQQYNQNSNQNLNQNITQDLNYQQYNQNSNLNYPDFKNQNIHCTVNTQGIGQSHQMNSNNYSQENSLWHKSLFSHKNPLFFQNNSSNVYCYDFINNQWIKLNNNQNVFFPKFIRATELPDGSYFLSGGELNGNTMNEACHFLAGNFIQKENMNLARKAHSAIYVKGHIYVFGGFNNSGVTNSVERYDMNNGGWKVLSNLIYSKAYASPLAYGDNYIFLIGGFGNQNVNGVN